MFIVLDYRICYSSLRDINLDMFIRKLTRNAYALIMSEIYQQSNFITYCVPMRKAQLCIIKDIMGAYESRMFS